MVYKGFNTFVDDEVFPVLFTIKTVITVRASQYSGFRKTVIFGWGKSGLADLAQHLRFALSIVPLPIGQFVTMGSSIFGIVIIALLSRIIIVGYYENNE